MTPTKINRQYGLWDSPVTAASLAQSLRFSDVDWDEDGSLVWLESRAGRGVLLVQPPDRQAARELNDGLAVRARLSYGGGDFSVGRGQVYFVEANSGRIYRQPSKYGPARPITPAFGFAASPTPSPDGKWLLYLHSYEGRDALAIIDADGQTWPQKLISAHDFYMQPAWHPDGERIAWVAWDHPNMPWDGTQLFLGKLCSNRGALPELVEHTVLAGDDKTAIFQPQFTPDGRALAYVSDVSGWWQIYLYDLASGEHRQLTHAPAEHGLPAWLQGMRTHDFSPDGQRLFCLRYQQGSVSLWGIDLQTGQEQRLNLPDDYTHLEQIRVSAHGLALIASGPQTPTRVITCQPLHGKTVALSELPVLVRRRSTSEALPKESYSRPEAVSWRTVDGERVYGLFYSPHSQRFEGFSKPPLVVHIHGGPTSQAYNSFNARAQFFTTRGYAFLEVNYRGSSGYGRAYRELLRGNWGVYDVQDAVSGAEHLVTAGRVDGKRLVLLGGSSGGLTVLKALQDYPGAFKAGICLYAVSNHFSLAAETHKFEAHYSDSLIGPLPDAADLYRQRSPIFFVDKIQDPVALFQGEDDLVVLRGQSDEFARSLQRRGVPHEYHVYPGEGHGFRKPETINHLYTTIEKFLRQYVIYT